MTLGTEERNAYAVEFLSNVTGYIMGKRPPLSATSLLESSSSSTNSSSRSLLFLALEMLVNCTRSSLIKGATLPGGKPRALVYICINSSNNYIECCIAVVQPDINVAVLKILDDKVDDENDNKNNNKDE